MEEIDDFATRLRIGSFVVGALLLSPVIVPIALIWHRWEERRLRAVLRRTACVTCGKLLTEEALEFAEKQGPENLNQVNRISSTHLDRSLPRPYIAVCTVCGQAYNWLRERNLLEPVAAETVAAYECRSGVSAGTPPDSASENEEMPNRNE